MTDKAVQQIRDFAERAAKVIKKAEDTAYNWDEWDETGDRSSRLLIEQSHLLQEAVTLLNGIELPERPVVSLAELLRREPLQEEDAEEPAATIEFEEKVLRNEELVKTLDAALGELDRGEGKPAQRQPISGLTPDEEEDLEEVVDAEAEEVEEELNEDVAAHHKFSDDSPVPLTTQSIPLQNEGFFVHWSEEDGEWIGTAHNFPSLSWGADTHAAALSGIKALVRDALDEDEGESTPVHVEVVAAPSVVSDAKPAVPARRERPAPPQL